MARFAVRDPIVGEFLIFSGGISVGIAGVITTSGEIEVMVGMLFDVESGPGADVPHGVATAAQLTQIGFAAVHDASVVQAGLARFEFTRNGFRGVTLGGNDLSVEDILLRVDTFVV